MGCPVFYFFPSWIYDVSIWILIKVTKYFFFVSMWIRDSFFFKHLYIDLFLWNLVTYRVTSKVHPRITYVDLFGWLLQKGKFVIFSPLFTSCLLNKMAFVSNSLYSIQSQRLLKYSSFSQSFSMETQATVSSLNSVCTTRNHVVLNPIFFFICTDFSWIRFLLVPIRKPLFPRTFYHCTKSCWHSSYY